MRPWRLALVTLVLLALLGNDVPHALLTGPPTAPDGWHSLAPPAIDHPGASVTLLPNGEVLLVGGYGGDDAIAPAERYDPVADRWAPAGALQGGRHGHAAVRLADGRVLVVGGAGRNSFVEDFQYRAEIYDPTTNAWTSTAPYQALDRGTTAVTLRDGRVLVAGGGYREAGLYDPTTDRWMRTGPLARGRTGSPLILLADGRVLAIGGDSDSDVTTAETYDPATGLWVLAGTLVAPHRYGYTATLLADGRVLVAGGSLAVGMGRISNTPTPIAELSDPATRTWAVAAPMGHGRVGHAAVLLPSGQVLVVSGRTTESGSNDPAARTTERFDPVRDRWVPDAPLTTLSGGPILALADGRVLAFGGTPAGYRPPAERCFTETNFCLQGRFLTYWQEYGGLARNGFPLTDERTELLEDGREYTVQYFERVRLEYHPENAPPYDVLLGQFGRRIFTYRGGQLAPAAPLPGQRYFPETGHNLGGRFLNYWQQNGGLAQFGYPLSEEQIDYRIGGPSDSYLVQYFERARLEYHPEHAGTPYEVLLAQFGRELLAEVDLLAGDFGRLHLTDERVRERLGRPRAAASQAAGATLAFEGGRMLWRGDTRLIYVLGGVGTRGTLVTDEYLRTIAFRDTWTEGQDPGGGPAPMAGLFLPPRGFGKIWRDGSSALDGKPPLPYVRDRLGYALTPAERGSTLTVQDFEHGLLLSDPEGRSITMIIDASAKCCIGGDYEQFAVR